MSHDGSERVGTGERPGVHGTDEPGERTVVEAGATRAAGGAEALGAEVPRATATWSRIVSGRRTSVVYQALDTR